MSTSASTSIVKPFVSLDSLEDDLVESWQVVSQATQRFLRLLREFDLRQGWRASGNTDCAGWLNWRCGISRTTAQEKVRVARALWGLPKIDAAFARGALSYSKVRALTRVASPRNEVALLDHALRSSAAGLEAYCRRLRNGDAEWSEKDAARARAGRSLTRYFRDDGTALLSVELPRAEAELVLKALEQVARALPEDPTRSLFAQGADALVHLARESLAGRGESGTSAEPYQVVVHVDAAALQGEGGEADLPLPTVRRLCCDGALVPLVEDANGTPLNVGRRQRSVTTALKRALLARDRTCTFPGCHHTQFLDAHHIRHWAEGGETSLDNLLTLCTTHHALVHEGGFRIQRHPDGRYYFVRPNGRAVEAAPPEHENEDAVRETPAVYRIAPPSAEDGSLSYPLAAPSVEDSPTYSRYSLYTEDAPMPHEHVSFSAEDIQLMAG